MSRSSIKPSANNTSKLNRGKKFTLFFMLALLVDIFSSCENEISKIKIYSKNEDLPSIAGEGFEMLMSDSSVIRFKLQTPEFIRHDKDRKPYTEFPKGINVEQYDARMKVISKISALYAKHFPEEDRWEAKNNVVAVNINGDTLKTEYLVWDNDKQKIYTDQFVKFIRNDEIFTGTGFESNSDFSNYKIKHLKGHLYVNVEK